MAQPIYINSFLGAFGILRYRVTVHREGEIVDQELFWTFRQAKARYESVKREATYVIFDDLFYRDDFGDCPYYYVHDNRTDVEKVGCDYQIGGRAACLHPPD